MSKPLRKDDQRFRRKDHAGLTYGFWMVLRRFPEGDGESWWCRCVCGKEKPVNSYNMTAGISKSCGCKSSSLISAAMQKHGCARRGAKSPEYNSWTAMRDRCSRPSHPKYSYYGGRGILVCERWKSSFENFLADMGPRLRGATLDRYPNKDGNYEPSNCRWATISQQMANQSKTILVTHGGETLCLTEWARRTGMSFTALRYRYSRGWPPEEIVNGRQATKEPKEKQHD